MTIKQLITALFTKDVPQTLMKLDKSVEELMEENTRRQIYFLYEQGLLFIPKKVLKEIDPEILTFMVLQGDSQFKDYLIVNMKNIDFIVDEPARDNNKEE